MSEYKELDKCIKRYKNHFKTFYAYDFYTKLNVKSSNINKSNFLRKSFDLFIIDFVEYVKVKLSKLKNVLFKKSNTIFILYFDNSNNCCSIIDFETFSFKTRLNSKQSYVGRIANKVKNDEKEYQERIKYTFNFVEVKNELTYFSKMFNLFIILLSKYIFLLSYNYFHNTNIIIFSNINFLISYTTFRHTLFKCVGGN